MKTENNLEEFMKLVSSLSVSINAYEKAAHSEKHEMFHRRRYLGMYYASKNIQKQLMKAINKTEGKKVYNL